MFGEPDCGPVVSSLSLFDCFSNMAKHVQNIHSCLAQTKYERRDQKRFHSRHKVHAISTLIHTRTAKLHGAAGIKISDCFREKVDSKVQFLEMDASWGR